MNFTRTLLKPILMVLAGGCASFGTELRLATGDVSTYRDEASLWGLEPSKESYIEALEKWPWAQGAQLHRRALVLSLKPSQMQIAELNSTREGSVELKLLNQLLGAKISKR